MYWKAPLVSLVMAVFVTISSAIPQFLGNYKLFLQPIVNE